MIEKTLSLGIKKLPHFDEALSLPHYATSGSSGADIYVSLPKEQREVGFEVKPLERVLIPTGLIFEIPQGFEIQVRPRSGLSLKSTLLMPNAPGTIDADYRGELKILLFNTGEKSYFVQHGMRLAQIILSPVWKMNFSLVDEVGETKRNQGGMGHTGGF